MNAEGLVRVWMRPAVGVNYIVGVDTADGVHRDRSVVAVLSRRSFSIDALFVSDETRPYEFANIVYKLATAYNGALIIPEADPRGRAVINFLLDRGYWNLWKRTAQDKVPQQATDLVGWQTTLRNKHVLLDELRRCLSRLRCWSL